MMQIKKCWIQAGVIAGVCLIAFGFSGCLSYSHYKYSQRAEAARVVPEGQKAKPGRIYFVSFPENLLAVSLCGLHPNIGHASLVTNDGKGTFKQYDYCWFKGSDVKCSDRVIGYKGDGPCYGVGERKVFSADQSAHATNDLEVARMVLGGIGKDKSGRGFYGDKVELWAKDVDDIGIAERYMEQLAEDRNRGSMAWKCWQIGGYRCGNITRQAFDAARGEYHWLDLLWGRFPGADAPSIGTGKTMWERKSYYGDCPQRRGNCMRGLVGGKHLPFYDANLIRDAAAQVVPFRLMATGR